MNSEIFHLGHGNSPNAGRSYISNHGLPDQRKKFLTIIYGKTDEKLGLKFAQVQRRENLMRSIN